MRRFLRRRTARVVTEKSAPAGPVRGEREPLTPEQATDLEQAWAELRQAAEKAGVSGLRTCTREGSSWEENAGIVRSVAAALRNLQRGETGT
ncbi:hypothetical protein [Arthrobacter bambusae]|uniref:hypothetical protein n=1 Tax=Arthrobacter bambusae TaxID=1338426 RepID=UPI00277DB6BC|nr:hypothetical protein [Arthrobacter bambusae]MDQ0241443.1 uncharacterized protein HemY [Arthrobacter bambusae]